MANLTQPAAEIATQSLAPPPAAPEVRGRGARVQIGLAVLAVQRARRGALARMRRSRLMLWRYRSPGADELLLAPPDLRAHDASFADEVAAGSFGLAGAVADLRGRSPFAIPPPSAAWARELHGFGWLRHLDGATSGEDRSDRGQARRRMDQGQPRRAGARLGARGRGPSRPLLAVARGLAARWRGAQALRRRDAQPDRSDHVSLHLLARCARRLPASRRPDLPRSRPPVHRRPRWPTGAIAEAPGGGAGAPGPARRRPHQPQSMGSRGAAARPAAAAPMLRRARPRRRTLRCSRPSGG